jgi:hypothetical protein
LSQSPLWKRSFVLDRGPPRKEPSRLPDGYDWPSLLDRDGAEFVKAFPT